MSLYPTFSIPAIVEDGVSNLPKYGTSAYFDYEKGDIVLDSAGRVIVADGYDAWIQWCVKTLSTEKSGYLAYNRNVGVEYERARALTTRDARERLLQRTITDALMSDPAKRTGQVKGFAFAWGSDSVVVSFTVIAKNGKSGVLSSTVAM